MVPDRKFRVGMRVIAESGEVLGDYTLHLAAAKISHLSAGGLDPEVATPFGTIRPYVIIEKKTLEKIIADEQAFSTDLIATKMKYMKEYTIKFL